MIEICDNAIDDDNDGLIDLNDDDCECLKPEPVSLIPNPSFEEQECCPSNRSQLNCATGWIQASLPTTDYIHSCGFLGWQGIPPPLPYPDGDGIMGFRDGRNIMGNAQPGWKEYAGACLLSPLKAGISYTFEFYLGFVNSIISPTINITFFGTPDCDELPFGQSDQFLGCPTNEVGSNWQRLSSTSQGGVGWKLVTLTITPTEDINAIAIGPACANNPSFNNLYYFFDNLVLAESKFFSKRISEENNPCKDDFLLSVEPTQGASYQWFRDGVAIVGETSTSYKPMFQEGEYAVLESLDGQCNLSRFYDYRVPRSTSIESALICENETYDFGSYSLGQSGTYTDTLKTMDGCDSIIYLDLKVLGDTQDSVNARIFDGEAFEIENYVFNEKGSYDVTLLSNIGCDSLVHLNLELYDVYIPNVFSPNEDGINDIFEIYVEEPDVNISSIQIFDRWGNKTFEFNSLRADELSFWNGTTNGEPAADGIYAYVIGFDIENSASKIVTGELTLLK